MLGFWVLGRYGWLAEACGNGEGDLSLSLWVRENLKLTEALEPLVPSQLLLAPVSTTASSDDG